MELYRISAVGVALTDALNAMLETGDMPVEEAIKVLETFDANFDAILRDHVLVKRGLMINDAQAVLANYNTYEDTWRIDAENFRLRLGSCVKKYDRVRLIFRKLHE